MNITTQPTRTIPTGKLDASAQTQPILCGNCRAAGYARCRDCKPSGLERCTGCKITVSLLPRGDVPQAWTETTVRLGSRQGPIQTFYYCYDCAQNCPIPDEGEVVAHERGENEIAFPGFLS